MVTSDYTDPRADSLDSETRQNSKTKNDALGSETITEGQDEQNQDPEVMYRRHHEH